MDAVEISELLASVSTSRKLADLRSSA